MTIDDLQDSRLPPATLVSRLAQPSFLTASAAVSTGARESDPQRWGQQPWQAEAWSFYKEEGPLRFAVTWSSNLCSRAVLFAGRLRPGFREPEPLPDSHPAQDLVAQLGGGRAMHPQLLHSLVTYLSVPGVGFLVASDQRLPGMPLSQTGPLPLSADGSATGRTHWRVYSADVLRLKSPTSNPDLNPPVYELQTGPAGANRGGWDELPPNTLVVRIWRPDEQFYWLPDSPARAALSSLRELRRTAQYVDAVLSSRIASAGILVLPQGATFPTAGPNPTGQHPFITELLDVMVRAVQNPGTAAQLVPIPIELPPDSAEVLRHVTFDTQLSQQAIDLRESSLRQVAVALDLPQEVVTGTDQMSHWGAWKVSEEAVQVHAKPLLRLLTSDLTAGYLQPTLVTLAENPEAAVSDLADLDFTATQEDDGSWVVDGVPLDEIVVGADTSDLASRPDRSKSAVEVYDRGELSGEALRRETGMSEFDEPTGTDLHRTLAKALMKNPRLAEAAALFLGLDLPETRPVLVNSGNGLFDQGGARQPDGGDRPDTPVDELDGEGTPDTAERPGRPNGVAPPAATLIPSFPPSDVQAFHASLVPGALDPRHLCLEQLFVRALERAGNRLRSTHRDHADLGDCPPESAHCCLEVGQDSVPDLLKGAWDRLPDLCADLGLPPTEVEAALHGLATTLLVRGQEYRRDWLVHALFGVTEVRRA